MQVEATRATYQCMIAAYREPDRAKGRGQMQALIDSVRSGVPAALSEVIALGRTLMKRAADVLLRPSRHEQRTHGCEQSMTRALARLRTQVPRSLAHYPPALSWKPAASDHC